MNIIKHFWSWTWQEKGKHGYWRWIRRGQTGNNVIDLPNRYNTVFEYFIPFIAY